MQEILDLQYLAYQSEAKLFNNPDIPPLKQTLADIENEYQKGIILKALNDKKLKFIYLEKGRNMEYEENQQ